MTIDFLLNILGVYTIMKLIFLLCLIGIISELYIISMK